MNILKTKSFKSEISRLSLDNNGKTIATVTYAGVEDAMPCARLVQEQRLLNDTAVVPHYIENAVAERNAIEWPDENGKTVTVLFNFFEKYWYTRLAANNPNAKALKAVVKGRKADKNEENFAGVSRYELYSSPDSADIVTAIKASRDPNVKPSFDLVCVNTKCDLDAWLSQTWGEGHQFYVRKDYHNLGLGSILFDSAAISLKKEGADQMLINLLSKNLESLAFYKHMGAVCGARIVEHNKRNNIVHDVPCDLSVLKL
jgi:hypothetical protein